MAPGTVLFHIGLQKTGTTSLQETLRRWPNPAGKPFDRPGGLEARDVQRAAKAGRLTGDRLDRHLAASQHDADLPVIFSAEALGGASRDWIVPTATPAAIAAQLATTTWDARVLVTLREPRSWLRSSYRYFVRGGFGGRYDRFLDLVSADLDRGDGVASWSATVRAYDDALGPDAVAVAWFEDLVDDAAAVWEAVADRLDLPALRRLGAEPLPRTNEAHLGPPWWELPLNRFVLRSDLHRGRGPRLMARPTYYRRIAPHLAQRSSDGWFTSRTTAAESEVVARLADAAEAIAAAHGAPSPRPR